MDAVYCTMDVFKEEQFSSAHLGHLGLVAAVKIKQFCRELANAPDFIYVGDSAIYANILQHSTDMFWITRAPEKIKEIRALVSIPETELIWTKLNNGYS